MGRLFQRRGAATEKARLPQELVEGGSERSNLVLERSGRDGIYGLMRHDI